MEKEQWKNIETEKPKDGQICLIVEEFEKSSRMVSAVYKGGEFLAYCWFTEELEIAEGFTHWMSAPLLPSGKQMFVKTKP